MDTIIAKILGPLTLSVGTAIQIMLTGRLTDKQKQGLLRLPAARFQKDAVTIHCFF